MTAVGNFLNITAEAQQILEQELQGEALCIKVLTLDGRFSYDLESVVVDPQKPFEDIAGVKLYIDNSSRRNLTGATLEAREGKLFIKNPNKPKSIIDETLTSDDELADKIEDFLRTTINPELGRHGGEVFLVGHKDGVIHLGFAGGCMGCSMAESTMRDGVERLLKTHIPGIECVVDRTAHQEGLNPWYK
jgi:Fe/S biogenesis protein NfuA